MTPVISDGKTHTYDRGVSLLKLAIQVQNT